MATPTPHAPAGDFSLVLGGPLYQLLRRAGLIRPPLDRLGPRIAVLTLVAWLPLLLLSAAAGRAWGESVAVPFLHDLEAQARFLVAVPLLIAAELLVHLRIGPVVRQFTERRLVDGEAVARFEAAVASAMRLRNSAVAEGALLLLATTAAHYLWLDQLALNAPTWFAAPAADGGLELHAAGTWYAFVSLPLFRLLLTRWLFRMLVWARFLWQVSRLDLRLVATHPDGAGGLAFLGMSAFALSPVLAAQGALLSGFIANRIFYAGARLPDYRYEILAMVVVLALFVLGPLCTFSPQLARVKRQGLSAYGILAGRYVRDFEDKWVKGVKADPEILGTGDIQSLADLGNSYGLVRAMRPVPFAREAVLQLVAATLIPLLPLTLTMIPLEDLLKRLAGVIL